MGKSKAAKAEEPEAITSVKGGNVTKSSQTTKSKSKEVAKAVAAKAKDVKKSSKKAVKEETPSSSDSESDAETSESSASSDESDAEEPVPKTNGAAKVNGKANGVVAKKDDSSEEDSDDSSEGSDDEKPAKANGVAAKDDSDSEEDSDESGSSDEDEAPKAKANGAVETKKAEAKDNSDDSEDDSEDGSDSSSEEEAEAPSKKRKAEVESTPVAKKVKADPSTPADASKNLFVGNLSWNVDEEWLKSEFEKFGTLEGVRIVTDRDSGRSKGFGYVEFANAEDAVKAHDSMKGTELDNRPLNVDYSKPREPKTFGDRSDRANKFGDKISEPTDTLFLGNLSFDADQDTVSSEFSKHGEVIGVRLPTDQQSGALKGFGYVQFASVDDAKAALTGMAGAQIAGRVIRLDYSQPRANNGGSPRGGRGDFGGRGRGRGGGRGDFRGGRGGGRGDFRGGRGGSTNRGGFGDFKGKKMTF